MESKFEFLIAKSRGKDWVRERAKELEQQAKEREMQERMEELRERKEEEEERQRAVEKRRMQLMIEGFYKSDVSHDYLAYMMEEEFKNRVQMFLLIESMKL